MGTVLNISISQNFKEEMKKVDNVQALAGKGLVGDRHFKDSNDKKRQVTLIEIENINFINQLFGTSIPDINFRRNIITQGIKLNELIGKEFSVGEVKLKAHDLCRPCKYLQERLGQKNLIKEFMYKGGLRCEILTDGKIFIGSEIKNNE